MRDPLATTELRIESPIPQYNLMQFRSTERLQLL
jgi:hypothetical protein